MDHPENFRKASQAMTDLLIDYTEGLRSKQLPVRPPADLLPGTLLSQLPQDPPEKSEEFSSIVKDVWDKILPTTTHWHHPNFHAYYPTSTSFASILGDMLSGGIGCVGFSWIASPSCTELEVLMLDWMAKAIKLPEKFWFSQASDAKGGGIIQDSASSSTLMMVLSLRSHILRLSGKESDDKAIVGRGAYIDKMVVYTSDQAHSSVERACDIAMIELRKIPTTCENKRGLNAHLLRNAIEKDLADGLIPLLCIASLGTTNSCAFDNLEEVGQVCNEMNVWLHVDAAYFGSTLICPEFQYLAKGVELVDSFNFNPHKMLRVSFDCSLLWVRDRTILNNSFNVSPTYLHHDYVGMPDFRHWQIPLGRRFRALKLWFVLRLHGLEGLRDFIRKHVGLAQLFEELICKDNRFELVNEVQCGLVCFRLKGGNNYTKKLEQQLLKNPSLYLVCGKFTSGINTKVGIGESELLFLRFIVCSYLATEEDIHFAFDTISKAADIVLEDETE